MAEYMKLWLAKDLYAFAVTLAVIAALVIAAGILYLFGRFLSGLEKAAKKYWEEHSNPKKSCQCQSCYLMNYEPTEYCPHCGAKMDGEVIAKIATTTKDGERNAIN